MPKPVTNTFAPRMMRRPLTMDELFEDLESFLQRVSQYSHDVGTGAMGDEADYLRAWLVSHRAHLEHQASELRSLMGEDDG